MITTARAQIHTFRSQEIHLIYAAQANEEVKVVTAAIKELATALGYSDPFNVHHRCPKPRTIGENALVFTDHPIRLARSPRDLTVLITALVKRRTEVLIPGYIHVKPDTETAAAFLALDEMRIAMRAARIREGLHLARQRGVRIGRKKTDGNLVPVFRAAKKECGSYRAATKALSQQGIEVSKSTLHTIVRGKR